MSPSSPPARPSRKTTARSKLKALLRFDLEMLSLRLPGCRLVGLDEVGRGSLVGCIVGGAVCLPPTLSRSEKKLLALLDDSKQLTAPIRAELSAAIHAIAWTGIGIAEKSEVETLNVHYASLLALYRAFQALCESAAEIALPPPGPTDSDDILLLMDGKAIIPDIHPAFQRAVIKGDGCSAAIAAASVIAKHARDTMLRQLAQDYPGYGWEENMGYATPAHLESIRTLGVTPLHRRQFKRVQEQLTLPLFSPPLFSTDST